MGKDTLGTLIRTRFPTLERRAFGDAVKEVLCSTFDVDLWFVEKWKRSPEIPPNFDVTMRQALQTVGDGFRTIRSSVWVDMALQHANTGIYCDVRYFNEAAALHRLGGLVILIGRSDALNDASNPSEATFGDIIRWFMQNTSENVVDVRKMASPPEEARCFDFFIRNDGSIDELAQNADMLFESNLV